MRSAIMLLPLMPLGACVSIWPEVEVTAPAVNCTSEAGSSLELSIVLSRRPSHRVDVWAVSSTSAEARVSGGLRFGRSNWDEPQSIVITGVDDRECDGDRAYAISVYARWHDDPSGGWLVEELYLINRDDDCHVAAR